MASKRCRAILSCALALAVCRPPAKPLLASPSRPSGSGATAVRGHVPPGLFQTRRPGVAHPLRALQLAAGDPGEPPSEEALACLRSTLEALDLLWAIPDSDLGQVARSLRLQEVQSEDVVFFQGDKAACFYIVEFGMFEVYHRSDDESAGIGEKEATVGPGEGFGELALISNDPHSATVVARSAGRLWRLEGQEMLRMMGEATDGADKWIMNSFRENRELGGLFWMLEEAGFLQLCKSMYRQDVEAGEAVVTEGDVATRFYVVDSGAFTVTKAESGDEPLCELGPGSSFGELGLLYNAPRQATVTATSDAQVWVMERPDFEAVVARLQKRPTMQSTIQFLRSAKMFEGVTESDLAWLAVVMRPQVVAPGEVLVEAGDEVNQIFLMQVGELQAWAPGEDGEEPIEVYREPGELVRKRSLLDPVWDVTIRADDATLVFWVSKLTLRMMFKGSMKQLHDNVESEDSGDWWWPF